MKIGYARISTDEQNLALQLDALKAAGCETVFTDQGVSEAVIERDGLSQALLGVGAGDVQVVWKLDRLTTALVSVPSVPTGAASVGGMTVQSGTKGTDTGGVVGVLIRCKKTLGTARGTIQRWRKSISPLRGCATILAIGRRKTWTG